METLLVIVIGVLTACGIYLMLRRNLLRFIYGLTMVSNAVNLLILVSGRLTKRDAPIVPVGEQTVSGVANPLPQALILTAIVISFGLTVFALALILKSYQVLGTVDTDELAHESEEDAPPELPDLDLPEHSEAPASPVGVAAVKGSAIKGNA
ncbi:MAG: Na+/H+ antiporter subunit C [Trueperaceae bacterium]